MKPSIALEALTLIMAVLLLAIGSAIHVDAQQITLSMNFTVQAPIPLGFTPISLTINEDDGVAVLGVDSEGDVTLFYYSMEGTLRWSLQLDGIEPVSVFTSEGYINAVTRDREGIVEIVRYYRISVEGEILQEYSYEVGKAVLIYYAEKTRLGILLVGVKHGGSSGWDPLTLLLVPGTGAVWSMDLTHPGDQEPVKPAVMDASGEACLLYTTRDAPEAMLLCIDTTTGKAISKSTLQLEGAGAEPVLMPTGGCIVYSINRGVVVVGQAGTKSILTSEPSPDALTEVTAVDPGNGILVAVLLGVSDGKPWAGLAMVGENGCPQGGLVSGYIGPRGIVPVAADSSGSIIAVAFAASEGASILALGVVNVGVEDDVQRTQQGEGEVTAAPGDGEEGGGESSVVAVLASPVATAILLVILLSVIVVVALRRRRAIVNPVKPAVPEG